MTDIVKGIVENRKVHVKYMTDNEKDISTKHLEKKKDFTRENGAVCTERI